MPARRHPRPDWIRQEQVTLGTRIAARRRDLGLSQDQLADLMGVERRTVQRYERAVTDPRYADLLLIARALDVHPADLLPPRDDSPGQ
ncbi:helix-turn-helix domain-containing protein [Streptomyces bullii]|uniref:Helix-turn-helix domain-containing protein n=1 Tax=Streptomyces bullii TaxID=349910 RepID=A0ABW0UMG5_9ACTN